MADYIKISVPLLIRCLEWAREDVTDDLQIHVFVDNMCSLSKDKLDSSDYPKFLRKRKQLKEDAPTNNVGSGAIADPQNKKLGGRVKNQTVRRWLDKKKGLILTSSK